MHLWTMVILAVAILAGCANPAEDKAKQLYDLAERYSDGFEYQRSVEMLQKITIDYAGTSYAKRAEEEIPKYESLYDIYLSSQERKVLSSFEQIGRSLENYKARFLFYPNQPSDLEKLPAVVTPSWEDVWGNTIHYRPLKSAGNASPDGYVLASFGKDGLPGGDGVNKDYFYKNGQRVAHIL